MSDEDFPTPYELSRIAAAIHGHRAGADPEEAAKQALALWFASSSEILNVQNRRDAEMQDQQKLENECLAEYGNPIRLSCDENRESEAQKWVYENAKNKLERFKSFSGFIKAYCTISPSYQPRFLRNKSCLYDSNPPVVVDIAALERFLRKREENRRTAGTTGTQKRRAKHREKNSPPQSEIAARNLSKCGGQDKKGA